MNRLIFIFLLFISYVSLSQDATDILKISEEKIQGIKSSYTEMIITIERPKWKKEMSMKGWSIGNDYFSSVVLSPVKKKVLFF